jgi:hypothetical protein
MNLATPEAFSAADLVREKTNSSASSFVSPLHGWKKSNQHFLAIAKEHYNSKA